MTARIFNIQTMSTEDGPGIRTSVFFKGCPLACEWCQNPEGLTREIHLVHDSIRCIGCGNCVDNCPQQAIEISPQGFTFTSACQKCLTCVNNCPSTAIRAIGEDITLEDLKAKLLRDRPFYENSGGGVTFTGGESLLQPEFVSAISDEMNKEGIHVCIDTSGYVKEEIFQRVVKKASLVLYDLKIIDEERHSFYTGVSNAPILENARWLGTSELPVWVRVAIIPGYTDDYANIESIAEFIRKNMLPVVERIDLLGYNDLCLNDYRRIRMEYKLEGTPRVKESEMMKLVELMKSAGVDHVTASNYREGE